MAIISGLIQQIADPGLDPLRRLVPQTQILRNPIGNAKADPGDFPRRARFARRILLNPRKTAKAYRPL